MASLPEWLYCALLGLISIITPPDEIGVFPEGEPDTYRADPELGFSHKLDYFRNYRTPAVTTLIHLDERGARVDGPEGPPVEEIDMITVGGSQAFGHGVRNEETFSSLVAEDLGFSVRNFAIPGQGGVQSLILLRRNKDLRPKLVLYGFWQDHYKRNVRVCQNRGGAACMEFPTVQFDANDQPYIQLPRTAEKTFQWANEWTRYSKRTDPSNSPISDLRWTFHLGMWKALEGMGAAINAEPRDWDGMNRAAEFVLSEMKKTTDEIGAVLIVAYIPLYFSETVEDTPPELIAAGERLGVPVVGITDRITELKKQGIEIYIEGDGHLDSLGHSIIAEEVVEELAILGFEDTKG